MIGFHLGGPANAGIWSYWNNLSGYELPKVVQMMAHDREGMGNFIYQARGIGEAEDKQPRPPGTERTLIINPESRFLKYSYITPLYTLSTQMDHPRAIHSHLSKVGRWHGMTITNNPDTRIVPVSLPVESDYSGSKRQYNMEGKYKTFQNGNTLILQRSRSFSEINPDWYPLYKQRTDQAIYIGNSWDEHVKRSGWLFLRKDDVYAAILVVLWDKAYEEEKAKKKTMDTQKLFHGAEEDATVKLAEHPYTMKYDDRFIVLNDRYSPVILQAGDKKQFESFEKFMTHVENASISLYKTVVPSFNILVLTPPGKDADEMVFNAANNEIPMLNGEHINYELPMTFNSPFIKSEFKSGKIEIQYDGEKLNLDFIQ